MELLLSSQHPPCCRTCMDCKKQRFLKMQALEAYKMPGTEILRVTNCIHISAILYFYLELMSKSVSLKILELKLVKLGCTII